MSKSSLESFSTCILCLSERSESPGEVMHINRLVGAFATRRCDKNHYLVC